MNRIKKSTYKSNKVKVVNKQYIKLFFVVLTVLITSCSREGNESESTDNKSAVTLIPVTVLEVNTSDYYEYGEYYGRVQGVNRASIINIFGGTVESVEVVEGTPVSSGDSLAKISAEKAQLAYDSAVLNEKISRENYQTFKKFLLSGNSSQLNVDQSHLQWLNSRTQLIDAKKAYDGAFCISPIDGVIVSRNIDKDDEVNPGQESFLIEDLSKIEIKIGIPEADMEGVQEGSLAEVTLDLYPGRVWEGTLTRYSRRSSDNNLTFSATIIVENEDRAILSGTTAKVKLMRNSYLDHIVLPANTVINEKDSNYVMVVNKNIVNKRYVELGTSNVNNCVILSGIEIGDTIVQEGLHLLIDSQQVKIINEGV